MMKYIAPSYQMTRVEAEDIITASSGSTSFEVTQNGTTSNGNAIYDAMVDINDYLVGLSK